MSLSWPGSAWPTAEKVRSAHSAAAVLGLHPADYPRIGPLLPSSGAGHVAFIRALLEDRAHGAVLVDDLVRPRTALACNANGFWFALGRPDAAMVDEAVPQLLHHSQLRHEPGTLFATSAAWSGALNPLFRHAELRNEYGAPPPRTPLAPFPAPPAYAVTPLDASLAATLADRGLDPWVVRIFGGPAGFERRSFGAAVLYRGRVVAFSAACAIGGGEAEVEIGTVREHRRRGLAMVAYDAFARMCERQGLRPAWSCSAANTPPVQMAAAIGFPLLRTVTGYPVTPGMRRVAGRWENAAPPPPAGS
jgi:GNAT superfamily N-acetyltransferase